MTSVVSAGAFTRILYSLTETKRATGLILSAPSRNTIGLTKREPGEKRSTEMYPSEAKQACCQQPD